MPSLHDRVKDVTTTTGTGTLTLAGSAPTGFRTFGSVLSDGDTTYYAIVGRGTGEWETGLGTYHTSGPTLARTTVLASSNSNSAVSFSAGTKDVFITLPGVKVLHGDTGTAGNFPQYAATGLLTDSGISAAGIPQVSGAPTATIDPATLSPVFLLYPDALSAGAVSSLASGGTAGTFVQASGGAQPTVTTNQLDGRKGLVYDGGDSLVAPTGGASLTGSWTVIEVRKHTSMTGYQNGLSWGDSGVSGKRRSPNFKYSGSDGMYFIGEGADVNSGIVLSNATWYVLVTTRNGSGGLISQYVNALPGTTGSPTLNSYTSTAINLGCNPGAGENFIGVHAYAVAIPSLLSDSDLAGVLAFLRDLFPSLSVPSKAYPLGYFSATNVVGESLVYQDVLGNVVIAGTTPTNVVNTAGGIIGPASLSVNGPVVLDAPASTGVHMIRSSISSQNVAIVWNKNSAGFSALTSNFPGAGANERGAHGCAPANTFPWGGPRGSIYEEVTNNGNYGDYRVVQTDLGASNHLKARLRDDTHAWEFYDDSVTEPSDGGPTPGLVSAFGRPTTSVADSATLDTTITTGSGHCGLLVVKDATNNKCAVYRLENATLTSVSADSEFSTSQGTASHVNVYNNSGQIRLENKTGGALLLTAAYYGA